MATEAPELVRIGALGDLHLGETDDPDAVAASLESCVDEADLLLVAGDLTSHGRIEQARLAAAALASVETTKVAVLGNHDHESDRAPWVRAVLEEAGIEILEGESCVVSVDGTDVGIAGVKGFGGGFRGASASDFGEPEMKAFIRHTKEVAARLEEILTGLDADVTVALLHYSPVEATLAGERLEIYPFLGSYLLGEAVDAGGAHLALHGHAHLGPERGTTAGGVEVRNVALPVLKQPYAVYPVPIPS